MKNNYSKKISWMLSILMVLGFAACKKDRGGLMFTPGTGSPTVTSVHTLSKTDTAGGTRGIISYDETGATTTTTVGTPAAVTAFDSVTVTGKLGNYYVLNGTNLGSTTKILINGTSIYFNRGLISDNTIVFSVPSNIAYVQPQPNKIEVITLHGSVTYAFTTLPPPPTVQTVSDYNFSAGTEITLKGQGFASVTAVTLKATKEAATLLSKNDSTLVIKMPSSTANSSALSFAYTSGTQTLNANSAQQFVNIDKAYLIFANGTYQNGWVNNSWGPATVSTTESKSGKGSFAATYAKGNYSADGFRNDYPGVSFKPEYKFLSFWIKGGSKDYTLYLTADKRPKGYGNNDETTPLTIPAHVWTYFNIPIATADLWAGGDPLKALGLWIKGPNDQNETFYFDEVMIVSK